MIAKILKNHMHIFISFLRCRWDFIFPIFFLDIPVLVILLIYICNCLQGCSRYGVGENDFGAGNSYFLFLYGPNYLHLFVFVQSCILHRTCSSLCAAFYFCDFWGWEGLCWSTHQILLEYVRF